MNSRPITQLDWNSGQVLTPMNLLTGQRAYCREFDLQNDCVPETDLSAIGHMEVLERDVQRHEIMAEWWKLFREEYLSEVRRFHYQGDAKAKFPKVGQIVMIQDDNNPRTAWVTGRVTKTVQAPFSLHPSALRLFGGNSSGDEESLVGGISSEEESKKRKRSAEELLPRKKIKISAVTPPEDIEMASVSPPTEPTAPGPAVQSPILVPGPNNVPVLVPVAEPNMIFNAHVINLRVYNAGHNVLRQQAALHFGPPAAQHEEEAAPPPIDEQGEVFFHLFFLNVKS